MGQQPNFNNDEFNFDDDFTAIVRRCKASVPLPPPNHSAVVVHAMRAQREQWLHRTILPFLLAGVFILSPFVFRIGSPKLLHTTSTLSDAHVVTESIASVMDDFSDHDHLEF